jgi:hypothetical protein
MHKTIQAKVITYNSIKMQNGEFTIFFNSVCLKAQLTL